MSQEYLFTTHLISRIMWCTCTSLLFFTVKKVMNWLRTWTCYLFHVLGYDGYIYIMYSYKNEHVPQQTRFFLFSPLFLLLGGKFLSSKFKKTWHVYLTNTELCELWWANEQPKMHSFPTKWRAKGRNKVIVEHQPQHDPSYKVGPLLVIKEDINPFQ